MNIKNRRKPLLFGIIFTVVICFSFIVLKGCGSVTVSNVDECSGITSTFKNVVYPYLSDTADSPGCARSGCHDGSSSAIDFTAANDTVYNALDAAAGVIDRSKPENSTLVTKPLSESFGGVSHDGGTLFNDRGNEIYLRFLCWIDDGGLNDGT
jgi:hypothetical protein